MKYFFLILLLFLNINSIYSQEIDSSFVFIKGGKFQMGSNSAQIDEKPVHKVKISDFYISKYEVTNLQYAVFLNEKGNQFEANTIWIDLQGSWRDEKCRIYMKDSVFLVEKGYENYPVAFVSWYGANAYCKWKNGRLPTEAEWEYIAKFDISYTDSLQNIAVLKSNSNSKINQGGTKQANILGIYDLYGNMSEWCYDWYQPKYTKKRKKNPQGNNFGEMKCRRGGSWYSPPKNIYPTNRKASNPNNNNVTIGFRVVWIIKNP